MFCMTIVAWAAVSFGSIDNAVLCVAISPTGLSPSAGRVTLCFVNYFESTNLAVGVL